MVTRFFFFKVYYDIIPLGHCTLYCPRFNLYPLICLLNVCLDLIGKSKHEYVLFILLYKNCLIIYNVIDWLVVVVVANIFDCVWKWRQVKLKCLVNCKSLFRCHLQKQRKYVVLCSMSSLQTRIRKLFTNFSELEFHISLC
jgi:hypothetical protein